MKQFSFILGATLLFITSCSCPKNKEIILEKVPFADSSCSYYTLKSCNEELKKSFDESRITAMSEVFKNFVSDDTTGWNEAKKNGEQSCFEDNEKNRACEFLFKAERYYQNPQIVSVTYSYYIYTGGANASFGEYTHSFDKTNGKRITLDSLIIDREKLLALSEKQFRKEHSIADTATLNSQDCFMFENSQFILPQQFEFTDKGVRFYFNLYEVACRIAGLPAYTIPYSDLTGIVKYINSDKKQ